MEPSMDMTVDSNVSPTEMEETLQQLFDVVNRLEEGPGNVPLLKKNVALAKKVQMTQEAAGGLEILANTVGCPISIWLEILTNIEQEVANISAGRALEIASLFRNALSDYASTEVAARIGAILSTLHAVVLSEQQVDHPMDGNGVSTTALLDEETARELWKAIISVSERVMSEDFGLWEAYIGWEEATALAKTGEDRDTALKALKGRYIAHLAVPHSRLTETAERYSTFNTTHFLEEYEPNMIKASNMSAKSLAKYQARETWEDGWQTLAKEVAESTMVEPTSLLDRRLAYLSAWLEMELSLPEQGTKNKGKGKGRETDSPKLEPFYVIMVFERMLSVASFRTERTSKVNESLIWLKYYRFMYATNGIAKAEAARILTRAARCCPESGEIWATLLRHQEAISKDITEMNSTYQRAHSLGLLTQGVHGPLSVGEVHPVEELVTLELAWCGLTRRMAEAMAFSDADERANQFDLVEVTIRESMQKVRSTYTKSDSGSRLELYLISWLEKRGQIAEAVQIWEHVCKVRPKDYQAWTGQVEFLIRHEHIPQARTALKIAANRQGMDWPQAIWSRWISFEETHGSIEQVVAAHSKVASLSDALARQMAEQSAAHNPEPIKPQPDQSTILETEDARTAPATKRKAEVASLDDTTNESTKRVKQDQTDIEKVESAPARDREFATVLISDLPEDVTEDMIRQRFNDCGEVREVVVTTKGTSTTASVEFIDRESVPAALTKDKKKIGDAQVHVYQAGQTTLFVTNFPEQMDDDAIRQLFSKYGEMLDPRWPSRKYKDSRRFCYVQFLTTASAHAACELNGQELEPGLALSVLISDPEKKKQRSDANSDQREVYITGLSRFVAEKDLRRLFGDFGEIKRVNLATDDEGHCKGFAFLEYTDEAAVESALSLDGTQLKKRVMKVKRIDPSAKSSKQAGEKQPVKQQRETDEVSRSIKLTGLASRTQEGLLQQALEKVAKVKRVEVFADSAEAVVEFASAADVGTFLLRGTEFDFAGNSLAVAPLGRSSEVPKAASRPVPASDNSTSASRQAMPLKPRPPKAGNRKRVLAIPQAKPASTGSPSTSIQPEQVGHNARDGMKGQDHFRDLLAGKPV
ncbi:hypothetical protein FFLO_06491 [Filobasidium floriforme]|uniref:U4/U6 snRNA-associated-splicing factor PRP24 n=1 Tax=Filobasidium floriforme TaxID=5210 RepID=A0A8K0JKE9_9TREE|nr:uncharacterized protein HD553DRAFT_320525 [Filobasidium floriforme]KAG7527949.1 hypothetical protein FFLO_06491 [Filobasidium floriforme]KAH8077673.1 hypothetical protein HD553DRAFT_320525 [Filobasidium floriforme]